MERPVEHREMEKLLKHLGFSCIRTTASHDHWEGEYDGLRRLVTLVEHHSPYHRGLLRDIRNQIGLSKKELFKLLDTI